MRTPRRFASRGQVGHPRSTSVRGTSSTPPSRSCHAVAASRFGGAGKRFVSTTPVRERHVGGKRGEHADGVDIGVGPNDHESDANGSHDADRELASARVPPRDQQRE